jgi:outer membrane receptor protein involved in Fe transport
VNGDQFEQAEDRTTFGGRLTVRRLDRWAGRHTESAAGVQLRRDSLAPVGLYHTAGRRRLDTVREDEVGQTMTGVFGQTEIEWSRLLRTTFGLRADIYQFSVVANHPENSGSGSKMLASPKFGAVFGPFAATEFYVNGGLGFHSNDARGATISVDPKTGEPVERVTPLVRARGAEFGVRTVRIRGLQSTFALWYLGLDSELLFVGDAGTSEPSRPSRRYGFEWANYWRPYPWLVADADLSLSRARFADDDPAGHAIPGALDRVISAGVTLHDPRGASGSLRLRHFGPRPLIEDASVTSQSTTLWNGDIGYRFSPRLQLSLDIFNLFNAEVSDVDYFYLSRLQDEPSGGIDDIHTHPALPRTVRLALKVSF